MHGMQFDLKALSGYLTESGISLAVYDLDPGFMNFSCSRLSEALKLDSEKVTKPIPELNPLLYHDADKYILEVLNLSLNDAGTGTWEHVCRMLQNNGSFAWIYIRFIVEKGRAKSQDKKLIVISLRLNFEKIEKLMLEKLIRHLSGINSKELLDRLTKRELHVLLLIANGLSYSKIAREMNIQPDTVNKHRKSIQRKLSVKSVAQLACLAKEAGVI